jgi:hypothetical protein
MADTQAGIGYGSVVEMTDAASPGTYTYLGEVKSITLPSETTDSVDATHMQSPNRTREYVEGLSDPGEFSFDMNLVPGSATDIALMAAKGVRKIIRITFPNGRQLIFTGFRTGYEKTAPLDDVMSATVTFKVSGEPTLTAVAAPRNLVAPVINGVAKVGVPLTADWGTWAGAMDFEYQWQAAGVDIVGATGPSYVPVADDVGDIITVEVTAANDDFTTMAESVATAAVVA